ncbi:MAG TPA: Crp/Fnr family transcriptional regulator, partial [Trueperaceae bacterium]|nr:Crp/Fnr family transcriptional regulator [Trueperaceae bacterium]
TLFLDGDPALGLLVIASGRVKIFVLSPATGREMVLSVEHQYGTVAELVALDGGAYPASAEATEPTELLIIEQESFQRVIHARPAIALHLMRTLGRRLRRLVSLIEQISFKEVVHRLAAYLLEETRGNLPYQLETNAVIATKLGTVPELVSRNLGRIHAGGAVVMEGRTIVAVDLDRLQELAAGAGR